MSVPSELTLLAAAIQYFERELFPTLSGELEFKTRVALNALKIVQREVAQQKAGSEVLSQPLAPPLVQQPVSQPQMTLGLDTPNSSAIQSNEALCSQIRSGQINLHDANLTAAIHQGLRRALEVNNPKWLSRP